LKLLESKRILLGIKQCLYLALFNFSDTFYCYLPSHSVSAMSSSKSYVVAPDPLYDNEQAITPFAGNSRTYKDNIYCENHCLILVNHLKTYISYTQCVANCIHKFSKISIYPSILLSTRIASRDCGFNPHLGLKAFRHYLNTAMCVS